MAVAVTGCNDGALEATIPELVYKCAGLDRIAMIFDAEKVTFTFDQIKNEMNRLAAGLLSTGLKPGDRVLICGSNTAHYLIASLACARAELIFSLISANFASTDYLQHVLTKGEFRVIICFAAARAELLNSLLNQISPELRHSSKGRLCSKAVPKLTHVIMAEEEHKHAGTFTLSEIYGKSNRDRIDKLPNFTCRNAHQLAAIQFSSGSSGKPKLVGLSHYQLINGSRTVLNAIGLDEKSCVACALPLFKIPVFALMALAPFISHTRIIFPSHSPIPKYLFESIEKYQCTHLLSNAVALHLIFKVAASQKPQMPSVTNVILLGERVPSEVVSSITTQFENVKTIVNGYMLTEVASVPLMNIKTSDMVRNIGQPLNGFEINIEEFGELSDGSKIGELFIRPINGTKFLGYENPFDGDTQWIATDEYYSDIVKLNENGDIELITNKDDLIMTSDSSKSIIEHWLIEKAICAHDQVKGAQVVALNKQSPLIAFIVFRSKQAQPEAIITDLLAICKNNKLAMPAKFAIVDDFPRINTKIQKYRLREMLASGEVNLLLPK